MTTTYSATTSVTDDPVTDDDALLKAFIRHQDQGAFTTLVRRHINFVHGTAFRALGKDKSLADDVTQAVFIVLSKKAGSIRAGRALPTWLHQTTLYATANTKKTQARRAHHEHVAAAERPEVAMTSIDDESHGASLMPLLDQAIGSLGNDDKMAVIARYLEGASTADVAKRLGTNTEAVQKRLERAVEKLRKYFAKRHLPATVAGITTLLLANSAHAAPPALAETIGVAAFTTTAVGTSAGAIAKGTLTMMNWIKIKLAAGIGTATLAVGLIGLGTAQALQDVVQPPVIKSAPVVEAVDDRIAIQGTWDFVAIGKAGRTAPENAIAGMKIIMTETEMQIVSPDGKVQESGIYVLDSTATPKHFDLRDKDNPDRSIPGLYSLNGDSLRICMDPRTAKRPTLIPENPAAVTGTIYVLKRSAGAKPVADVDPAILKAESVKGVRDVVLSIITYQNKQKKMPPRDTKFLRNNGQEIVSPSAKSGNGYVYLGDETVRLIGVSPIERTAIVYDDAGKSDAGVAVGFLDGHCEWIQVADLEPLLQLSKQSLDAARRP